MKMQNDGDDAIEAAKDRLIEIAVEVDSWPFVRRAAFISHVIHWLTVVARTIDPVHERASQSHEWVNEAIHLLSNRLTDMLQGFLTCEYITFAVFVECLDDNQVRSVAWAASVSFDLMIPMELSPPVHLSGTPEPWSSTNVSTDQDCDSVEPVP